MTTTITAASQLIELLPVNATINTITEKEGESHRVRFLAVDAHCLIRDVTGLAAAVMGQTTDSRGRLIVRGHGINFGDHAVKRLATILYRDSAALRNHTV
jgi:hypothetical protein